MKNVSRVPNVSLMCPERQEIGFHSHFHNPPSTIHDAGGPRIPQHARLCSQNQRWTLARTFTKH